MDLLVEGRGLGHELVDVGLEEVILLRVEVLQEGLAPLDGRRVVDLRLGHVAPLQERDHNLGRLLVVGGGHGRRRLGADDEGHDSQEPERRNWTQHGSGHKFRIPLFEILRSEKPPGHTESS